MKKIILSIIIVSLGFSISAQNLQVDVTGDAIFDSSNFSVSEAGEDYSSSSNMEKSIFLTIRLSDSWSGKSNPKVSWTVSIHKSDLIWDTNLTLTTKRNGDGENLNSKGKVKIYDGTSYQSISNNPIYFFSGESEVANIPLKLKLNGLSIVMGARDFETNIMLTVYDDL